MKKQYIQPELEAIDIKMNTVLCASVGFTDTEFDNGSALAPEDNFDFGDDNDFVIEEENFSF